MSGIDLFEEFENDGVAEVSCVDNGGSISCRGKVEERDYKGCRLSLCEAHAKVIDNYGNERTAKTVGWMYEEGLATKHGEGFTYVLGMANGNRKIGMTGDPSMERILTVSQKNNGGEMVEVLAVVEGGRTKELCLHNQWRDIRVPDQMEEFRSTPDLEEWITGLGIHEGVAQAVGEVTGQVPQERRGYAFVTLLDNGTVHLSSSRDRNLGRVKQVSKTANGGYPAEILAVIPGGASKRDELEQEWSEYSRRDANLFTPDPVLIAEARRYGIDPAVEKYSMRQYIRWASRVRGILPDPVTEKAATPGNSKDLFDGEEW